jgi:hypothetical protein
MSLRAALAARREFMCREEEGVVPRQEDLASPGSSTDFLKSIRLPTGAVKALGNRELRSREGKGLAQTHSAN